MTGKALINLRGGLFDVSICICCSSSIHRVTRHIANSLSINLILSVLCISL